MAPELFDSDRICDIGVKIDIWSLGCVFVELFSGKRPWDYITSANHNCIYYEIFKKKPLPIPNNVPEEIQRII